VAQCRQRVDAGCAARRDVAGQQGDREAVILWSRHL